MADLLTKLERILVPLDASPASTHVVEYACAVARGVGATLALLHVYEPPNEMVGLVPGATVGGEVAAEQDLGREVLERAAAVVQGSGLAAPERILERAPQASRAIISHARAGKFDLIVMGMHARGRVQRIVVGSVAEQVLQAAPCPVLVVHLPAA